MKTDWLAKPGPENTDRVIDAVEERLSGGDIAAVVIATTSGDTALRFAKRLLPGAADLIAVTHHVGFRGGDASDLDPENASALESIGVGVLTASHALSGVNRSLSKTFGGTTELEVIAHTLRLFGQGLKVCVEIAVMVADAGLIPTDRNVICIGGSGKGADTAVVLQAAHSNAFFETKIRETLCRPIDR